MTRRVAALLAAFVVVLGLSWSRDVEAHAIGASNGDYRLDNGVLVAELTFARGEIVALVPELDADHHGVVTAADLAAHRAQVAAKIVPKIVVVAGSAPCPGAMDELTLTQEDGIVVRARWKCPGGSTKVTARLDLLDDLSHGHRHFASVTSDGATSHPVLYRGFASFEVSGRASDTSTWTLFRMGIEHILTGYDHLVFLLGLVLVGGRIRSLLGVISAFTLAHSITLALAALDVWAPSPRFVEPAIALSIAYVGVENFFVKDANKRWRITFPFGLVHGFGFAGALREINLPRSLVPKALVLFNLGVEAGQLAVLVVLLPIILYMRKFPQFDRLAVRFISAGIVVAGVVWFVVRVRGT